MKIRLLSAALAWLCANPALAYKIVEARYGVETARGLRDQIIVRCDDGRMLTLPWEARPAEACLETPQARAALREAAVSSINEAHQWCVRGNPRSTCDEVRANALKAVAALTPAVAPR